MLDGPHHDVPVDNQSPIVVSSGILRNEPRYLRTRNACEVDDLLTISLAHILLEVQLLCRTRVSTFRLAFIFFDPSSNIMPPII
jgi:hypothetical protein